MAFIAEMELSSRLLQRATEAVPEMDLELQDLQTSEDSLAKYVFWATGGNYEKFETAMADDPTVEDFAFLLEVGDRQLYRLTFTKEAGDRLAYPMASEFDIVFLQLTNSNGTSNLRAQIPSLSALRSLRDACVENDISFRLKRLYHEESDPKHDRYDLTPQQREALVLAYESGYFGDTRTSNLEEIASDLDISRQALAGRLRRGHERLIESTLI